jgi:spore germination protein GerM
VSRLRLRLVALVLVLLAGACSLDTDEEPEAIHGPTSAASASSDASTVELPSSATENVSVWFLQNRTADLGAFVVATQRQVALPADPGAWLEALFQQPPDLSERESGVWSAIPTDTHLVSPPEQDGHVLRIQLPDLVYEDLHGLVARYAFAQIVFTATEIPDIESVQFLRSDGVFPAVDDQGQSHTDPLSRDDYDEYLP